MNKPEPPPDDFNTYARPKQNAFSALSGADPEILQECPVPDKFFVTRIGLHLILTVAFIFGCLVFSLSKNLATDASSQIFVIFLSLSISIAIFIVDIYIIHASWEEDGQKALETTSRDQRFRFQKKTSRVAKLAPRLVVSLVVSVVIAVFLDLYIYQREISRQLIENARSETETARKDLQNIIEKDLATRQEQINKLNDEISDVARRSSGTSTTASAIVALDKARSRLLAQKRPLDNALAKIQASLLNTPNLAGRKSLQQRARAVQSSLATTQAQLNSNQASIDAIQKSTPSADDLIKESQRLSQRRDSLVEQLNKARTNVEEEVTRRLKEKGGQALPADGFSARFSALLQYLGKSWSALGLFVLLTMLMMFVEISAVISKIFFSPKTIYAVRVASNYNRLLRQEAFMPDISDQKEVEKLRLKAEIEVLKAEINASQVNRL